MRMMSAYKKEKNPASPGVTKTKPLNASLSDDTMNLLTESSSTIKNVCSKLASIIEDQVTNPNPQTGGEDGTVVSRRLLEWTSDLYAIAEDIDFYVNPPVPAE